MPPTPDTTVVRAPRGRTFTDWTPDDLAAAEALADGGSLRMAAELCWSLLADGRVRAALEGRVKGLLGLPVSFEESGDGRSSPRAARALAGGDWWATHPEAALAQVASWGILLGVGLGQYVWHRSAVSGRWLPVLEPYDVRWLRWDGPSGRWLVQTAGGVDVEVVPGDGRWLLYAPSAGEAARGDLSPWAWGAWRACRKPWLLKDLAWDDWGHHSNVHGSPIRAGLLPDPTDGRQQLTRDQRRELANDLSAIGGDASIVPPAGVKLELLEAKARTWEMFPGQIDAAARETVIAINGQSSSVELTDGQQTGATLHKTVRADLIRADAETLSSTTRAQGLTHYARVNFGDSELAPWTRWRTQPPADVGARGAGLKALAEGIEAAERTAPPGKVVDRATLYAEGGVPLLDAPEPPTEPETDP